MPEPSARARSLIASGDFDSSELQQAITSLGSDRCRSRDPVHFRECSSERSNLRFFHGVSFPFLPPLQSWSSARPLEIGTMKLAFGMMSVLESRISSGKVESTLGYIEFFPDGKLKKRLLAIEYCQRLEDLISMLLANGFRINDPELRAKMINAISLGGTDAKDATKAAEFIS